VSGAALAAGWAADLAFGDPRRFHPVAGFGRLALAVERALYAPSRTGGALFAATLVGLAALTAEAAARGAERLAGRRGRALVLAAITWGALGGRSLAGEGRRIAALVQQDRIDAAREALPALAGRDPSQLDASGLSRAVVESLAENTADAVVGALVWGAAGGPAGVAAYRAANTLDAMVGHRSERYERFGFAAAKLDDAMGWPGARLGALLTVASAPLVGGSARAAWRVLRRDGAAHPSPNAGRMEAAFAGALDLGLGGPLQYGDRHEDRPHLGDGRAPTAVDAQRAARLSLAVGVGAAVVTALSGAVRSRMTAPLYSPGMNRRPLIRQEVRA
jgi:adenosylcobinamide-phosphate synthase